METKKNTALEAYLLAVRSKNVDKKEYFTLEKGKYVPVAREKQALPRINAQ